MIDRPIIFSAPMVRALLVGTKTQTRRVLKPQPTLNESGLWRYPPDSVCDGDPKKWVKRFGGFCQTDDDGLKSFLAPVGRRNFLPYAPGDRLYVREAWRTLNRFNDQPVPVGAMVAFEADQPYAPGANGAPISNGGRAGRLRPSIHMPRWASRITLTVTEVRVQRLQEISEADAVAEGIERLKSGRGFYDPTVEKAMVRFGEWTSTARQGFCRLWNSLHGPDAWDANPWVVAVSFTVRRGNIDA